MLFPGQIVIRTVAAGACGVALLLGNAATAAAQPPPGCTAADLARISGGVSNATADYLFTRPDVNDFFTGLEGQDDAMMRDTVQTYLDANPQVKSELQGIRQPLNDFRTRCQPNDASGG